MRAYITKITKEYGHNGECYHICFHSTNPDKSYDAYVVCKFRNFLQWDKYVIQPFLKGAQVWLDGLVSIRDNAGRDCMISADSPFFVYRVIYPQKEEVKNIS